MFNIWDVTKTIVFLLAYLGMLGESQHTNLQGMQARTKDSCRRGGIGTGVDGLPLYSLH